MQVKPILNIQYIKVFFFLLSFLYMEMILHYIIYKYTVKAYNLCFHHNITIVFLVILDIFLMILYFFINKKIYV
jgi:hypothetical protein